MKLKNVGVFCLALFLGLSLGFTIDEALSTVEKRETIHTLTLTWSGIDIEAGGGIDGWVCEWSATSPIIILGVDVWMGKPYDILWEGDVFLTTRYDIDPWHPGTDEVLVHYQFDSHASSPLTHFRSFNLRPGFAVYEEETVYVYRLFNSFDVKPTWSGDGWVRLYFIYVQGR